MDSHTQVETLTPAQAYFIASDAKFMWFCAGRGCFALGTMIQMYEGHSKAVEDVVVGDFVMGDDMKPRMVCSLAKGTDQMYRISAVDGEQSFECNAGHSCVLMDKSTGVASDVLVSDVWNDPSRYQYLTHPAFYGDDFVRANEIKIEKTTIKEYRGFLIDGNHRFVLKDGTITSNSGKTTVGALWVCKMGMRYPKAQGLIAANTYNQLHGATLPPVLAYFRKIGLDFRVNKRPPEAWLKDTPFAMADYKNVLTLQTGAHIFLRSLDKPEPIRGLNLGWAWLDEIASTSRTAWDIIVGALRDPNCDELHIRVTGSPDGWQWCAEEFDKRFSKDPEIAKLYDIVFMSSRDNPWLPKDFLSSMLSSYDRRRALQEVDGRILIDQDFNTYYEFRPTIHVKDLIPYNPNQPLILSWDFNSSQNAPMSMIVSQQHQFSNGVPFIQVLDEFVIHGGNTPMVCDAFLKRYYPTHKSSIKVYGDASGTRSTVGTSDFQVVKECLGPRFPSIEFFVPRKNMTIKDRVNAVNAMLLNAKGEIRLFIHPQCKELIEDYKKVKPNNHGLIDKSDPARTHTSDAVGYYIAREFPVKFAAPAGMNSISGLNLNER